MTESLIVLVLLGVISLLILGLVRRSLRPASERDPAKLPAAATAPGAPSTAAPEPTPAPAAEKAKEKAATE